MDDRGFFSIDKLIEFGLGLSVAQQMVQIMNQSMQQMYVPGSMQSMPQPQVIYVAVDGKSVGPLTESGFLKLVSESKVTKSSLAWMPGMLNWQPIEQIPAILKIIALAPPALPL